MLFWVGSSGETYGVGTKGSEQGRVYSDVSMISDKIVLQFCSVLYGDKSACVGRGVRMERGGGGRFGCDDGGWAERRAEVRQSSRI